MTALAPVATLSDFGRAVAGLIASTTNRTTTVLAIDGTTATITRDAARAVLAARAAEKIATTEKERLEKALKTEIGDTVEEIAVEGQVVFTWKTQSKQVLDTARLKAELPEVYAAYAKTQTTRPLLARPKVVTALFG